jgi:hypothetical protein
MGDVIGLL